MNKRVPLSVALATAALALLTAGCEPAAAPPATPPGAVHQPPAAPTAPPQAPPHTAELKQGPDFPVTLRQGKAGSLGPPLDVTWSRAVAGTGGTIFAVAPAQMGGGVLMTPGLTRLYRTAGDNWQLENLLPGVAGISALASVPGHPDQLAAWGVGFWASSGGRSWRRVNPDHPFDPERTVDMIHFTDDTGKRAVFTVIAAHNVAGYFASDDGLQTVTKLSQTQFTHVAWLPSHAGDGFSSALGKDVGVKDQPDAIVPVRLTEGGRLVQRVTGMPASIWFRNASKSLVAHCGVAGAGASLCVSDDEGATWEQRALPAGVESLALHLRTDAADGTVFATDRRQDGWYVSVDTGSTWRRLRWSDGRLDIAAYDERDGTLYALVNEPGDKGGVRAVYTAHLSL